MKELFLGSQVFVCGGSNIDDGEISAACYILGMCFSVKLIKYLI
jgi:hypothetical protein